MTKEKMCGNCKYCLYIKFVTTVGLSKDVVSKTGWYYCFKKDTLTRKSYSFSTDVSDKYYCGYEEGEMKNIGTYHFHTSKILKEKIRIFERYCKICSKIYKIKNKRCPEKFCSVECKKEWELIQRLRLLLRDLKNKDIEMGDKID